MVVRFPGRCSCCEVDDHCFECYGIDYSPLGSDNVYPVYLRLNVCSSAMLVFRVNHMNAREWLKTRCVAARSARPFLVGITTTSRWFVHFLHYSCHPLSVYISFPLIGQNDAGNRRLIFAVVFRQKWPSLDVHKLLHDIVISDGAMSLPQRHFQKPVHNYGFHNILNYAELSKVKPLTTLHTR